MSSPKIPNSSIQKFNELVESSLTGVFFKRYTKLDSLKEIETNFPKLIETEKLAEKSIDEIHRLHGGDLKTLQGHVSKISNTSSNTSSTIRQVFSYVFPSTRNEEDSIKTSIAAQNTLFLKTIVKKAQEE